MTQLPEAKEAIGSYNYTKTTNKKTFLYHPDQAPKGRIFSSIEAEGYVDKNGWVDSPAKFPGAIVAKVAEKPNEFVEKIVANEKQVFIKSLAEAVHGGTAITFSEVFHQLTYKEIVSLLRVLDTEAARNAVKSVASKEVIKETVITLIQAHNANLEK